MCTVGKPCPSYYLDAIVEMVSIYIFIYGAQNSHSPGDSENSIVPNSQVITTNFYASVKKVRTCEWAWDPVKELWTGSLTGQTRCERDLSPINGTTYISTAPLTFGRNRSLMIEISHLWTGPITFPVTWPFTFELTSVNGACMCERTVYLWTNHPHVEETNTYRCDRNVPKHCKRVYAVQTKPHVNVNRACTCDWVVHLWFGRNIFNCADDSYIVNETLRNS